MKVLVIGDFHFMARTKSFTDEAVRDILEYLDSHPEIEMVIHLGDILDSHGKIDLLSQTRACSFLNELGDRRKTICLIGNHDIVNERIYLPKENCLSVYSHPNVKIVSEACFDENFVYVPYVPNGKFQEAIKNIDLGNKLIFAHQEFRGSDLGGFKSENGDEWSGNQIVSGHIHKCHTLPRVFYAGTPYQVDFSDLDEKGIWILDIKEGEIILKEKYVLPHVPVRRIIEGTWQEIQSQLKEIQGKYTKIKYTYTEEDLNDPKYKKFVTVLNKMKSNQQIYTHSRHLLSETIPPPKPVHLSPHDHILEGIPDHLRSVFNDLCC